LRDGQDRKTAVREWRLVSMARELGRRQLTPCKESERKSKIRSRSRNLVPPRSQR
jgi:hypothetical protein